MKLTKRITSLLVVFMFAFTSLCAFAADIEFSDVTESNTYYEAISSLVSDGVINGYEDGTFKPENTITRAEFSKLLAVSSAPTGYAFTAATTSFSDIADMNAEHGWAVPYIAYAVSTKAVNGYEDGTFRAGNPVTYGEAVKMIVCTLGYGPVVNTSLNPWYQGYIDVAVQIGLTKNAMSLGDNPASRGIVAQLIYNMGSCKVLEATGVDQNGNPVYTTGDGSSFNDKKDNATSAEGVVYGVTDFAIDGAKIGKNKVKIDDKIYNIGRNYDLDDLKALVGYRVSYSYSGTGDKQEITKISKLNGSNSAVTLEPWQIESISGSNIIYYASKADERADKETKVTVSGIYVVYNGVPVDPSDIDSSFINEYFNVETGSIKLLSNDSNEKSIEVAFIESYKTYFASSPSYNDGIVTIYDKNQSYTGLSSLTIDEDDVASVKKVASKGASAVDSSISAISNKSVVSIAVPYDTTEGTNIIISASYVTGEVKELSSDYETIVIGSDEYELSPYYELLLEKGCPDMGFEVGDNCKFYLDYLGRIVYTEKNTTSTPYGLLVSYGSGGSLDSGYYLNIMTATNKFLKYKMKDNIKINGSSMSAASAIDFLKENCPTYSESNPTYIIQPVKYTTSGSGDNAVFSALETIDESIKPYPIKNTVNTEKAPYANNGKLKYSKNGYSFKHTDGTSQFNLTSSGTNATTVFVVPNNTADEAKYKKTTASYFSDGTSYCVEPYDVESSNAKLVLVYLTSGQTSSVSIGASTPVYLVEGVSQISNGEGQEVRKLTYKKLTETDSTAKTLMSSDESEIINKLDTLNPGDIIKFVTEDGVISKVQTVFKDGALTTETGNVKGGNANHITLSGESITDYYQAITGTIYQQDDEANQLAIIPYFIDEVSFDVDNYISLTQTESTTFYKFNKTREIFELSSSGAIKRYADFADTEPENASSALVIVMNNKVVGVYLLDE